jgi:ribonucleoside-diphosphate reductase alpha chain
VTPAAELIEAESRSAREALLQSAVAAAGESGLAEVAARVARAVAAAEGSAERARVEERFAAAIASERFFPSVPILANAGGLGQLAACFVLEPEDRLDSIYEVLGRAARIQQGSGGVGVHFSKLRPRGAPIRRSGGSSPGPLAFVELFAHSARINSLSGRRAGAHLAVLRDDHPDLLEFVRAAARGPESFAGVGLAVGVTDALLEAAERGEAWTLRGPGVAPATLPARELLEETARAQLASGNPTLLFLDAIAAGNPVPHLGRIEATNPCGEQPLLPGESCVLGSLHLPAFAGARGEPDWDALRAATADAIRFLDDVVEVQRDPDPACAAASRRTRKVGLGVMGFADLLLLRGVAYDAPEAAAFADALMRAIARAAADASEALAAERGPYPAWRGDGRPRRNATALAVAPTGTLRLLAGCSGGLEPFLDPVVRVQRGELELRAVDRTLLAWLGGRARDPGAVVSALEAGASAAELPGLTGPERLLLRRAPELAPEAQLALQAAFQRHVDGAVSKTVHLPAHAEVGDVVRWTALARRLGCKGVAFFRASGPGAAPCLRCGELALD